MSLQHRLDRWIFPETNNILPTCVEDSRQLIRRPSCVPLTLQFIFLLLLQLHKDVFPPITRAHADLLHNRRRRRSDIAQAISVRLTAGSVRARVQRVRQLGEQLHR